MKINHIFLTKVKTTSTIHIVYKRSHQNVTNHHSNLL